MIRLERFIGTLLLAVVLAWPGASWVNHVQAQTRAHEPLTDAPCRSTTFERIVRHADEVYDKLLDTRGVEQPVRGDIRKPDVSDASRQLSGLSRELNAKVLVLTREAHMVCGYLIGFSGTAPAIEASYPVGDVKEIARMVSDARFAFGIYPSQASRAPQLRGARAVTALEPMAEVARKSFRDLGARLIPAGVLALLPVQGNLMVLPTGIVATLPFAALVPEQASSPLSEQVVLSILPALDAGPQARIIHWAGPGASGDRVLVLGNPDLAAHKDWRFPPLPGAEAEARSVSVALPGWAYFGREATSDRLFAHADEADIIYLATHAVSHESEALDKGFIALSDQLITPRKIQKRNFKASLAVLSACQTGLGAPHDGGTVGLARAFYLAGVPGIIMSLWSVDDDATKALMGSFMRHLETRAPQEALSLAMRERRQIDSNPAKWASFIYFGFPMVSP